MSRTLQGWTHCLLMWMFLVIPFGMLGLDWWGARIEQERKEREAARREAQMLLDEMRAAGSTENRLRVQLARFQDALERAMADFAPWKVREGIPGDYSRCLEGLFPPHALLVAAPLSAFERVGLALSRQEPGRGLVACIDGIGLASGLRRFCQWFAPYLVKPGSLLMPLWECSTLPDVSGKALGTLIPLMDGQSCLEGQYASISRDLTRFLQFPLESVLLENVQHAIVGRREAALQIFSSLSGGARAIAWCYPRAVSGRRVFVGGLLSLQNIDPGLAEKDLVRRVPSHTGLAFLAPRGGGAPSLSEVFRRTPELRRHLKRFIFRPPATTVMLEVAGFMLAVSPTLIGRHSMVAVAVSIGAPSDLKPGEFLLIVGLAILFCVAFVLIGERIVFQRGWRLTVGVVTLLSFVSIGLLPNGLSRFLIRKALGDHLDGARAKAAARLEDDLRRVDEVYLLLHADLAYRYAVSTIGKEGRPYVSGEVNGNDFLRQAETRCQTMYPSNFGWNSALLAAIGGRGVPNGVWAGGIKPQDIPDLFATLIRQMLDRLRGPSGKTTSGEHSERSDKASLSGVREEMTQDFVGSFLQGVLGPDAYFRLISDPFGLIEVASNFNSTFALISPLPDARLASALALWVWSDYNEQDWFLNRIINDRGNRGENFELIAVRNAEHQAWEKTSRPAPPAMMELLDRTRRVSLPLSAETRDGSGTWLMRTNPGQRCRLFILGGMASLEGVLRDGRRAESAVWFLSLGMLTVSLGLILWLTRHFLKPLRELRAGLQEIAAGRFATRLDAGRPDEFGDLAALFNRMARGVQEGSLLGQYVSSAVLEVIRDKAAFERAQKGEQREMTVLFSSLAHASTDLEPTSPAAMLEALGLHLSACSEAVKRHGGLIDKVIGDKVMIFFDHAGLGDASLAVNAAVNTAGSIVRAMRLTGRQVQIGIASGPVVAGILGARKVRLDYTVIGDTVNLAARLNALAKSREDGGVIMADSTRLHLAEEFPCRSLGEIVVKGKTRPVVPFVWVDQDALS